MRQGHRGQERGIPQFQLDNDAGARYLGEFAIGTNERINKFTGQILFDEKIGGSFIWPWGTATLNPRAKT